MAIIGAIMKQNLQKIIIPLGALACLLPQVSAATALLLGVAIALLFGNCYAAHTPKITKKLLSLSVIGLGAGMNLLVVMQVGAKGIGYTAVSIFLTLSLGILLGRLLKAEKEAALLVAVGTAICGGSAIAAVAPVVNAKNHNISVSLGVVFLLNALALFIFPNVGHYMNLSQSQFGLWSALAIHDTSSVVGAGSIYGKEALEIATTVKLARALWIVPLVILIQAVQNRKQTSGESKAKPKYPWFILGFLGMSALVTWVPMFTAEGAVVASVARKMLVVTLFLIGTNMTRDTLKAVGLKPLVHGMLLWVIVASVSLASIYEGLIH